MKGTQTQPLLSTLSTVNQSGGKTQGIFAVGTISRKLGEFLMEGYEGVPSLQPTKSQLKMDDWKTVSFPFRARRSLAGAMPNLFQRGWFLMKGMLQRSLPSGESRGLATHKKGGDL